MREKKKPPPYMLSIVRLDDQKNRTRKTSSERPYIVQDKDNQKNRTRRKTRSPSTSSSSSDEDKEEEEVISKPFHQLVRRRDRQ
jgi:hypothetical protein